MIFIIVASNAYHYVNVVRVRVRVRVRFRVRVLPSLPFGCRGSFEFRRVTLMVGRTRVVIDRIKCAKSLPDSGILNIIWVLKIYLKNDYTT